MSSFTEPEDALAERLSRLYRCGPIMRWGQGSDRELVHFQLGRINRSLPSPIAAALDNWTSFLTPEAFSGAVTQAFPSLRPGDVLSEIRELASGGCLVPRSALAPRLPLQSVRPTLGIGCLAIPTANRPRSLKRGLGSFAKNLKQFDRKCGILVADGSAGDSKSIRASCASSAESLYFAGSEEKRDFAAHLGRKGDIPAEVIQYALFGSGISSQTIGANRNAILLHALDCAFLSVDDDTICDVRLAPGTGAGLSIAGHDDANEAWCFPDAPAARLFGDPKTVDVIGEHEKYLGRQVREILPDDHTPGDALDQLCIHLLSSLSTGIAPIRVTWNGARGDSGFHSSLGQVSSGSATTRARLQSMGDGYAACLNSRQLARQVLRPSVSHVELAPVGMFMGLDSTLPLPPFPPDCRNEDGVFAHVLARMSDGYYGVYLPFMLAHDPPEARSYAPNCDSQIRLSDLIIYCLSTWHPAPGEIDPYRRVVAMGRHLQSLGDLPAADFDELANVLMCARICSTADALEAVLSADGRVSRAWAEDVTARIENLRGTPSIPDFFVPVDLSRQPGANDSSEARRRRAQRAVSWYGELLEWWPAIVERSLELRSADITISRRLI